MNLKNKFLAQEASPALLQLSQVAQKLQGNFKEATNFSTPPDTDNKATLNKNFLFDAFISNQADPAKTLKQLLNFDHKQLYCLFNVVEFVARLALYTDREETCQDTIQDLLSILLLPLKQEEGGGSLPQCLKNT